MSSKVICDVCSSEYPLVFPWSKDIDETQGWGCASFKWDEAHIRCFYGSKHDDDKYMWVNKTRPEEYNKCDNICDSCIDNLESQGILIMLRYQ